MSTAHALGDLTDLREKGLLTEAEFEWAVLRTLTKVADRSRLAREEQTSPPLEMPAATTHSTSPGRTRRSTVLGGLSRLTEPTSSRKGLGWLVATIIALPLLLLLLAGLADVTVSAGSPASVSYAAQSPAVAVADVHIQQLLAHTAAAVPTATTA